MCLGRFCLHVWQKCIIGVEAMSRANEDIRHKTAVNILNATLILLKKESTWYNKQKNLAWNHEHVLTPKGMELMEEAFNNVNVQDFKVHLTETKMSILQLSARTSQNRKRLVLNLNDTQ